VAVAVVGVVVVVVVVPLTKLIVGKDFTISDMENNLFQNTY